MASRCYRKEAGRIYTSGVFRPERNIKRKWLFFSSTAFFLCVPLVFPPPLRKMFPPVGAETAAPTADVSTNGRPGGRQWNTNFCPNRFFFFLSLSLSLPFSLKDKIKLLEFFFFVEKMGGGGEEKSLFKKRKKRFHVKELRPALKMTNIDTASGVPHFLSPYCFFFSYWALMDVTELRWILPDFLGHFSRCEAPICAPRSDRWVRGIVLFSSADSMMRRFGRRQKLTIAPSSSRRVSHVSTAFKVSCASQCW